MTDKYPLRKRGLKVKPVLPPGAPLPPGPPPVQAISSKYGVNPALLEILTQPDFLDVSAEALQTMDSRKTKDGITLCSSSQILDDDTCYARMTHFGRSAGAFQSHIFTVGRNFLLRSLQNRSEWETLLDDFQERALTGLKRAVEMGYTAPQGADPSVMRHYFEFYYACNLRLPKANESREPPSIPPQSALESLRDVLDKAVTQVPNLQLADKGYRTSLWIVNHNILAHVLSEETGTNILRNYRRLVFDMADGKSLRLAPTILCGVHAFAPEVEGSHPAPLKASFVEPTLETITEASIDELAQLINSRVTKEPDFQRYFEKHPGLLCEDSSYRIYCQLVLERDDGSTLRPDFFLEPISAGMERLPTVVDLKLPTEELILSQRNRDRFYSKMYEYAAQLREYGDYFDSPGNRKRVFEYYGIRALRPRLVMIVGKDYGTADYSLIERVNRSIFPVEVRTYDDILRFGKSLLARKPLMADSGASK